MNSNGTADYTGNTASECQIPFLALIPTQTVTELGYAVHMFIAVLSSIAYPLTTVVNLCLNNEMKNMLRAFNSELCC